MSTGRMLPVLCSRTHSSLSLAGSTFRSSWSTGSTVCKGRRRGHSQSLRPCQGQQRPLQGSAVHRGVRAENPGALVPTVRLVHCTLPLSQRASMTRQGAPGLQARRPPTPSTCPHLNIPEQGRWNLASGNLNVSGLFIYFLARNLPGEAIRSQLL